MTDITITFHQDERPAAEASRYHDIRAYRDPVKDEDFFTKTGHEHLLPQYTHLNRDLVDINLDDFYDHVYTQPLAEWNSKQKHKAKRVGKGLALPAGVSKSDAPAYAKAVRVILYEKYKWIEGYDAISLLSDPDVYDKYEALSKAHPKAKKEYWLSQLDVYTTAKTAGEMYLSELRAGVRDGVKGAVRPSCSFILQYGSCDDPEYTENRDDPYWQRGADMLEEALERFKKDNPNLRVIEATIHLDEAKKPPHMHVEAVPVIQQKRGRPLVTSMTGALKAEGYERKDKSFDAGIDAWSEWIADQRSMMAEIAKDHGLTPVKSGKEGAHEANSRLYRLGRQIEEAAQEYASVRLLIDEATYELDSVGHAKTQTEAERATADQQLAQSKAELARVKQKIDELHKTEQTLRKAVKDLREQYQAELAKTTGAEESLKKSAKALRDAVDEVFSSQTLAGMGLDDITEGTDKAADEDKSLDDLVAEATSRVDHMLDLDVTDPFLDKYIKVINRQKKAEAVAKAAEDKAEDEKTRADSAFDIEYKAKKQKLDKREKALDKREKEIADKKDKAHKSALEAARLLREREKALDKRKKEIDQEIEAKAEEKAKTKIKDKIKQVISDFKYRVHYGYAEKAYDIYHYKDVRYWRSKTEAEQGEYLEARDQYAQQCGVGISSYGDVDKACLSRSPVKKPYRRVRCAAHGLLKGIFGARDDAKDAGIDISGILPDGIERDLESVEQTYSAEKSIR